MTSLTLPSSTDSSMIIACFCRGFPAASAFRCFEPSSDSVLVVLRRCLQCKKSHFVHSYLQHYQPYTQWRNCRISWSVLLCFIKHHQLYQKYLFPAYLAERLECASLSESTCSDVTSLPAFLLICLCSLASSSLTV